MGCEVHAAKLRQLELETLLRRCRALEGESPGIFPEGELVAVGHGLCLVPGPRQRVPGLEGSSPVGQDRRGRLGRRFRRCVTRSIVQRADEEQTCFFLGPLLGHPNE